MSAGAIALIVLALFVLITAMAGVRIVPQARAGIVERLGRYSRTLDAGLTLIVPFIDRVKPLIDLREQVVAFPPQPVITEDNLVVGIDTVIYFTVTDPKAATYEIANPLQAIEQLTVTTLRNVIGGLTLEETLTSRDNINSQLRVVLDEATGRWGIRVNRVELKSVEPPRTVQEAMEKQMRAERDRRATILTAEGIKQSQILTAEGEKQAAVLKAEGARTSAILKAEGEAKAIDTVFQAIHDGAPDQQLLSYQYLQMLPQLAQGPANKIFIIPSEFSQALQNIGGAIGNIAGGGAGGDPTAPPRAARQVTSGGTDEVDEKAAADAAEAAARGRRGRRGGRGRLAVGHAARRGDDPARPGRRRPGHRVPRAVDRTPGAARPRGGAHGRAQRSVTLRVTGAPPSTTTFTVAFAPRRRASFLRSARLGLSVSFTVPPAGALPLAVATTPRSFVTFSVAFTEQAAAQVTETGRPRFGDLLRPQGLHGDGRSAGLPARAAVAGSAAGRALARTGRDLRRAPVGLARAAGWRARACWRRSRIRSP